MVVAPRGCADEIQISQSISFTPEHEPPSVPREARAQIPELLSETPETFGKMPLPWLDIDTCSNPPITSMLGSTTPPPQVD
jgi:hypothetical protein